MWDHLWDWIVDTARDTFIPLVYAYYAVSGSLFLNSASTDATGLEHAGDVLLSPFQYVFCGQLATPARDGKWVYTQRFDYKDAFWVKMGASLLALPISTALGATVKGLAYLSSTTREHRSARIASYKNSIPSSHLEQYEAWGIKMGEAEWIASQGYQRRPGEENLLSLEKEALREIAALLNAANIPWWIDCGTCLGAYRYGGGIPWDWDIDIAVLEPGFDNVRRTLSQLDPQKYSLQDWSGRMNPHTYFKVYVRKTRTLIDIYHFAIEPETKTLRFIFSLDTSCVFPEWTKIRERRFTVPTSFDTVFPLKKTLFDGVEVFIPNDPVKYLQRYYGSNLDPVRIYDPVTNCYEKVLDHPYWEKQYVH